MSDRSKKTQYYLIACGTSKYKNYGEDEQLYSIQTEQQQEFL